MYILIIFITLIIINKIIIPYLQIKKRNIILNLFEHLKNKFNFTGYIENKNYLKGKINNYSIEIEYQPPTDNFTFFPLLITIRNLIIINCDIEITSKSLATKLFETINFNYTRTYDALFDSKFTIRSFHNHYTNILLTQRVRNVISDIMNKNIKLEIIKKNVIMRVKLDNNIYSKINNYLENIIILCEELNKKKAIKKICIGNIKNEEHIEVKLNNLYFLIKNYSRDSAVQNFFKELLTHKNIDIQINASLHLKDKKIANLHLIKILQSNNLLTVKNIISIINYFGENKVIEATSLLQEIYSKTNTDEIKLEILQAFYNFNDKGLLDYLFSLLEKSEYENGTIKKQIIKIIGKLGNKETVKKLFLYKDKSLFYPYGIQEAIAKIKSQLGSVQAGWISEVKTSPRNGTLSKAEKNKSGGISKTGKT